jgi:hypothetical protein
LLIYGHGPNASHAAKQVSALLRVLLALVLSDCATETSYPADAGRGEGA